MAYQYKKADYRIVKNRYIRKRKPYPGRPAKHRKTKHLTYEEARHYVRQEELTGKADFDFWWDIQRPSIIPRYPPLFYRNDGWVSWYDFLGVEPKDIQYFKNKNFRPYEEASAYAQTLNLGSQIDWLEYIKENDIPDDIPRRPDIYYNKHGSWLSWKNFLGYSNVERLKNYKKNTLILYICQLPHRPQNVYKFGVTSGGVSSVKDAIEKYNIRVIRMYKIDEKYDWRTIVSSNASPYPQGVEDEYMLHNVFAYLSKFDNELEQVLPN